MKKLFIILTAIIFLTVLSGCSQNTLSTESASQILENQTENIETIGVGGGGEVAGDEDINTVQEVPLAGECH